MNENEAGDLLILVSIKVDGSEVEEAGWIDCKYVEISSSEENLNELQQKCSDLQTDN